MAYEAKVVEVLIASPGDITTERASVRSAIFEWNASYARERQVVLSPMGWETHSSPELSGRPQQMINDRLLRHADILVGIFWARIGSPTGKAISGSVEEIERHHALGKPVMLYFSEAPMPPALVDPEQYAKLETFKAWAKTQGLIETFATATEFDAKFRLHLPAVLRDNPYLQQLLAQPPTVDQVVGAARSRPVGGLSPDAQQALEAATAHNEGTIYLMHGIDNSIFQAGSLALNLPDRATTARWEAALEELEERGLIRATSSNHNVFKVTHNGYKAIEK